MLSKAAADIQQGVSIDLNALKKKPVLINLSIKEQNQIVVVIKTVGKGKTEEKPFREGNFSPAEVLKNIPVFNFHGSHREIPASFPW